MLQKAYLEKVGPVKGYMLGASMQHCKERANNQEDLIGWARAPHPKTCPIGALARYLVWQIDCCGLQLLTQMEMDLDWLDANGEKVRCSSLV